MLSVVQLGAATIMRYRLEPEWRCRNASNRLLVACGPRSMRSVADGVAAVRFARDEDLLIAVRGGGRNVAGLLSCEGGIGV